MRDYCIANSTSGAKFNAKDLGYPESHYHIIYNGVDSNLFKPRPRIEALQALGLDHELFWVGTFASFKERKNHPMLLRAAALLLKEQPDIRYVWVGDELTGDQQGSHEYKLSILRMIETLGLKNHIHLLGNRSNVQSIYPACDLTVLPSRIEGTPNVALESMASGVPVIATDVSDNTYIIPDGIVGRIVKLNDEIALAAAISELKCNNKLRLQFATNARNWVEQQFSLSQLTSKTNSIYSDVIIDGLVKT
jgi:glycosyltransferase involved in cell wall biosynthesis